MVALGWARWPTVNILNKFYIRCYTQDPEGDVLPGVIRFFGEVTSNRSYKQDGSSRGRRGREPGSGAEAAVVTLAMLFVVSDGIT